MMYEHELLNVILVDIYGPTGIPKARVLWCGKSVIFRHVQSPVGPKWTDWDLNPDVRLAKAPVYQISLSAHLIFWA